MSWFFLANWLQVVRRRPRPGQRKPTTPSYFPNFGLKVYYVHNSGIWTCLKYQPQSILLSIFTDVSPGAPAEASQTSTTQWKTGRKSCKLILARSCARESNIRNISGLKNNFLSESFWLSACLLWAKWGISPRKSKCNPQSIFIHIKKTLTNTPAAPWTRDRWLLLGAWQIWADRAICE